MPKVDPITPTEEARRRKISATLTGRKRTTPITEETRSKMSVAKIGIKHSAEAIRKSSAARRGKKRSEETRRKISESLIGRKLSAEHRRKLSVVQTRQPKGEAAYRWKGGRIVDNGYVLIRVGRRYVQEHRIVMQEMIGRPMTGYESVHHKNAIRDDNRPENLELRGRYHGKGATKHCPTCTCGIRASADYERGTG